MSTNGIEFFAQKKLLVFEVKQTNYVPLFADRRKIFELNFANIDFSSSDGGASFPSFISDEISNPVCSAHQ